MLNKTAADEIRELSSLLGALRPFKDCWSGMTYIDKAYELVAKELDAACKRLVEGDGK